MGKKISLAATILLVAGWLALFFSGRGVLIWFTQPGEKVGMLHCHYFTGTEIVNRQFLYSQQGFLGRETCPRVVELEQ
ncbi:MAG TPA: YobH family protein [Verrucomicrobiae bacterium]|nr:YobH family protein [Verrucomicrobiae bacterium]